MEQVTIQIDPKGNVTLSVKGVKGKSCKALTANLEKGLGVAVKSCPTPEMNEVSHVAQR